MQCTPMLDLDCRSYRRAEYDVVTSDLISEAVEALLALDAGSGFGSDHYPMVTLLNYHVGALVKHGRATEAKKASARYYERLRVLEREGVPDPLVTDAKERAFRFATVGEWDRPTAGKAGKKGRHRNFPRGRSVPPKGSGADK